jgi:GNAT superfamily N-acetyltransferase
MSPTIALAQTAAETDACFDAFHALRPHLTRETFAAQVQRQQAQGYQVLAYRRAGQVSSVAGFRMAEFLAWGKVLYIDDLSTLPHERAQGGGSALLDWLIHHATAAHCAAVHLDTGYARHAAHRLYLRKGFELSSHHMALALPAPPAHPSPSSP